jgi:hypothetical protein
MIGDTRSQPASQISVLHDGQDWRLYCCHSVRTKDMAGNAHVLSVGVDLSPALAENGADAPAIVNEIAEECRRRGGSAKIPRAAVDSLRAIANVLNIAWVEDSLADPARIICPRSSRCPQTSNCGSTHATRARDITDVRQEILGSLKA